MPRTSASVATETTAPSVVGKLDRRYRNDRDARLEREPHVPAARPEAHLARGGDGPTRVDAAPGKRAVFFVGNHSGIGIVDVLCLVGAFGDVRGPGRRAVGMMHDLFVRAPVIGPIARAFGAVRPTRAIPLVHEPLEPGRRSAFLDELTDLLCAYLLLARPWRT